MIKVTDFTIGDPSLTPTETEVILYNCHWTTAFCEERFMILLEGFPLESSIRGSAQKLWRIQSIVELKDIFILFNIFSYESVVA